MKPLPKRRGKTTRLTRIPKQQLHFLVEIIRNNLAVAQKFRVYGGKKPIYCGKKTVRYYS